jgi:predicted RNA-binding Zn ribbon-like protein
LHESPAPNELIGGRLAIDFANLAPSTEDLSWQELLHFLLITRIISPERSAQLLSLPQTNLQSSDALLRKAQHLRFSLQQIFRALVSKQSVAHEWIETLNEILRVTEGHDELIQEATEWRLEFVAREDSLDWLLAAIARSGAEIVAEGVGARLRLCANPRCGLFFYDQSRTRRRRWCSMARCGNRHKVASFARRHALHRGQR